MGKIGSWIKSTNKSDYMVWHLPQEPMHNAHIIVVHKQYGQWETFVAIGDGRKILNEGGTKDKNMKIVTKYMRSRPNG